MSQQEVKLTPEQMLQKRREYLQHLEFEYKEKNKEGESQQLDSFGQVYYSDAREDEILSKGWTHTKYCDYDNALQAHDIKTLPVGGGPCLECNGGHSNSFCIYSDCTKYYDHPDTCCSKPGGQIGGRHRMINGENKKKLNNSEKRDLRYQMYITKKSIRPPTYNGNNDSDDDSDDDSQLFDRLPGSFSSGSTSAPPPFSRHRTRRRGPSPFPLRPRRRGNINSSNNNYFKTNLEIQLLDSNWNAPNHSNINSVSITDNNSNLTIEQILEQSKEEWLPEDGDLNDEDDDLDDEDVYMIDNGASGGTQNNPFTVSITKSTNN